MKREELVKKLEFGIEELILLSIIILNVFDAFEILGSDWDYIKKIISWTALGILVYKVSPSKLFVGFRKKNLDKILIIGYFLMIIKNIISYAFVAVNDASHFLKPLYSFLILYASTIEEIGLYIGLFLILVVSFNLALRTPLKAPSLLHLMRADKIKHDAKTFFLHFFSLIFIAIGFFLVFFNLVMEWLAIGIDAPLLMISLVIYFFFIIKHHNKFTPGSFLSKFGDFGSDFYKGVLEHIRYKHTFLRIISGMLILHILTDMLTFIWNYIFGIGDALYFNLIGPHPSFVQLVSSDLSVSWLTGIIHFSNLVGLFFLMITPIIMWLIMYFNKKIKLNNQALIFIFYSLIVLILNPTFQITALGKNFIYGVDITGILAGTNQILPFSWTIIIASLIALIVSRIHLKSLKVILVIASKVFFVMYAGLYFFSLASYYWVTIPHLISSIPFLGFIFIIFFIITILFYVVGIISFLSDTHKHLEEHLSS